jgi:hypothetical protein
VNNSRKERTADPIELKDTHRCVLIQFIGVETSYRQLEEIQNGFQRRGYDKRKAQAAIDDLLLFGLIERGQFSYRLTCNGFDFVLRTWQPTYPYTRRISLTIPKEDAPKRTSDE